MELERLELRFSNAIFLVRTPTRLSVYAKLALLNPPQIGGIGKGQGVPCPYKYLPQVLFPDWIELRRLPVGARENKFWRVWFAHQFHLGFKRRAVPFFAVAFAAGGDNIFPRVLAAPRARHHVVKRQVAARFATKLAGVIVAPKDISAVEGNVIARWTFDVTPQSNHARHADAGARRMQELRAILDPFGNLVHQERDRTFDRANMQWLKAGVQDQHHWRVQVQTLAWRANTLKRIVRVVRQTMRTNLEMIWSLELPWLVLALGAWHRLFYTRFGF